MPWGDSSRLKVAEWVMAIGNPYQLSQSVSLGIVSALGRSNVGISTYEDFIQTDAAINPGNSGGALVNARGELIGINTAIFTQSGGYQGIGFAVPSNLARHIVDDLSKYGEVRRGSIGYLEVAPLTTQIASELNAPSADGVVVTGLRQGPAARAGIEPYDIILSVNGQKIGDTATLLKLISDAPIGSSVAIEVLRDGKRQTLRVPIERQGQRLRPRSQLSVQLPTPRRPLPDVLAITLALAFAADAAAAAALTAGRLARRLLTSVGREPALNPRAAHRARRRRDDVRAGLHRPRLPVARPGRRRSASRPALRGARTLGGGDGRAYPRRCWCSPSPSSAI